METLVATALLVTALAGVAQLVTASARFLLDAGRGETALIAAQAKLESLRSLAWTYDALGGPISDPSLAPSPAGALDADLEGYSDYLDHGGRAVDRTGEAAMFRRRWSIVRVDDGAPDALAIEVCVARMGDGVRSALAAEACLMAVRTRQP